MKNVISFKIDKRGVLTWSEKLEKLISEGVRLLGI